jgi:hypothetical protein
MEITDEIHKELGKTLNGEVWNLLGKTDRTEDDTRRMIHAAHASLYHWLHVGTPANEVRGEWMIANVYSRLGHGEPALRHASRCAEVAEEHPEDMKDFDVAYASEGLARAYASLGKKDEATQQKTKARKLGDLIADPEDKKIYDGDWDSGPWYGVE